MRAAMPQARKGGDGLEFSDFSDIVKAERTMVFRIAFGYVKCTHDAEDITQDVFMKLYKIMQEPQFAAYENMKAWLIRVTINQSKSLLRTAWKTRRSDVFNDEAALAAQSFTKGSESYELYEYVDSLKPKYRTVIYLYYYEGYSVKEIAEILQIRQTTVTTQLDRARKQLKEKILEDKEQGGYYEKGIQGNI
jgi:RNA polymerase sigma-70 factor (ECF subfamily)